MSEPLATSRRAVVGSLLGLALGAARTADSRAAEKPAALAPLPVAAARAEGNAPFPVIIEVDASATLGELKPIWRFFGADEPNYATHRDGKTLVAELGELSPHPTPLYKKKASEAAGHSGRTTS